ncbi:BREX-1 system adenine-specific DNA-methyltransferase PglX [Idiomarina sp.]|uniref:BREX-1 system adenine-specific DNA-methyltransferase PglX n=1 Tax=Idiomarina sp. TaxID=1874361 RepID=UPI003A939559
MNTKHVKSYAPKARNQFKKAVEQRLNLFGIFAPEKPAKGTKAEDTLKARVSKATQQGSVLEIGSNTFDAKLAPQRERLAKRAQDVGFEVLLENVAYTWFNRFSAIRFMELRVGYLEHGFRVLSHPTKEHGFEVLDHAIEAADSLGLNRQHIEELKLAGDQDEALFRELILGQCHQLYEAMPFLFEKLDDETELLLPDNLTRTDSVIRGLVDDIPEDNWQDVEIIGWLYQFYISEKKDQVIGKVVKSEDIPAATQLFTPNWIVQHLVQNSLGRHWLMTYPDSPLKQQMQYYIEPGEQPDEVMAQLKAITPTSIEPESIKVLDPACGSGHILVEAYKVLKAIYEERGYRSRDIPQLILKHNLYGLDIDDRAGQLAGFTLMMLAREDDRRLFSRVASGDVHLNIAALQETKHLKIDKLWQALNLTGDWQKGTSQGLFEDSHESLSSASADERYKLLKETLAHFNDAKTFGSLIEVSDDKAQALAYLLAELQRLTIEGDAIQRSAASKLVPYIKQAWILALRYDAVIANPPYMGSKGMNVALKDFAKKSYPNSKSDLFAIFMERGFKLLNDHRYNAMVTMQSWMFLSSYERMRKDILENSSIECLVHMANGVMGIAFGTSGTVMKRAGSPLTKGAYCFVEHSDLSDDNRPEDFPPLNERNMGAAKQSG